MGIDLIFLAISIRIPPPLNELRAFFLVMQCRLSLGLLEGMQVLTDFESFG